MSPVFPHKGIPWTQQERQECEIQVEALITTFCRNATRRDMRRFETALTTALNGYVTAKREGWPLEARTYWAEVGAVMRRAHRV